MERQLPSCPQPRCSRKSDLVLSGLWDTGHLGEALAEGYVYAGHYSTFRQRRHGHSSRDIPAHQFVVCAQNHDQVGNRMLGERLSQLVAFEALKVASERCAAVTLSSPVVHGGGIR